MRVAVFGAGYVGLVTGACLADLGHEVVVRDVVAEKIEALRAGQVPIHEDGLEEVLERNGERLSFTLDVGEAVEGADVLYIAVGTPPTYSGDADLSAVWTVVDELPQVDRRIVVAMKSTVPVGTGRAVRHRLDDRGFANVGYVSNPEFTAEGTAVRDFMQPDRIVIGAFDAADGDVIARLHEGIDAPIVRCDVPSAEMIKLAANAALVTRISFINEIANVCEATGADVTTVAEGIGLDRRIGPAFLRAGIGFGGSCFPKDSLALKQLAANSGYNFQLLNAVIEVNELQKRRVIGKLERRLGPLRGKRIALLGLAFKPGTDDMREAPSLVLAGRLLSEGAEVTAWDPVANGKAHLHGVEIAATALDALDSADAAVVVTEWPEIRELDWAAAGERMRNRVIVDGRNLLDPEALRALGFTYEGIGRPVHMSLPAVILVGGQGTRLRPLTDRVRKDMLPLVDRPLLAYTFEHLARHGVERGIISCGYLPDQIEASFGAQHDGMALEYAVEDEPLGTGGAIGFAGRELEGSFFALNGDSLREADLEEMVAFHRSTSAKATILLTPVADPSRYGLVRTGSDGRVETFLEKPRPEEIDTDLINAGLYVLEPEVLDLVPPDRAVSIEREVFPRLAAEGSVYGIALPGYWLDVGTPETYLQAHRDVLERIFPTRWATRSARTSRSSTRLPTCTPPRSWFLPCTWGRGQSSRKARGSEAWPCSVQGPGWRLAESSRTPSSERARASARARRSSGRSSETTRSSATPASCATLPSSALVPLSARATSWTTASGSARVSAFPTRRSGSREPVSHVPPTGREAMGLGARLGRGGGVRGKAPLRSSRGVLEPAVPRAKGRVVARARRPCAARARRGGG